MITTHHLLKSVDQSKMQHRDETSKNQNIEKLGCSWITFQSFGIICCSGPRQISLNEICEDLIVEGEQYFNVPLTPATGLAGLKVPSLLRYRLDNPKSIIILYYVNVIQDIEA
uniref:Uncharacterized protein n=1 Tax=Romanomermis culicivorax TaxID=13658 RepID=A0A915KZE1_ROMCU